MKCVLMATLILATAITIGCSRSSAKKPENTTASQPSSTPIAKIGDKIIIRMAHWGLISRYKDQIEKYAASQGLELELIFLQPLLLEHEDVFNYIRSEKADMVITPKDLIKSASSRLINVLEPIEIGRLKNYAELDPQLKPGGEYYSTDQHEGKTYCVPYRADIQTLLYDSSRVSEPKSYDVLLQPEAKRKFGLQKYQRENNIRIPLAILGYKHTTYYDMDSEDVVWEKVRSVTQSLLKNAYFAYDVDANPNVVIVGIPDENIMQCLYYYGMGSMIPGLNKLGGKWRAARIKLGIELWIDAFCISSALDNQPEKLKAAYLIIDFMLSEQMQIAAFKDQAYAPVTTEARAKLRSEGFDDFRLASDFFKDNVNSQAIPRKVRSLNFYATIWDEAAEKIGRETEFIPSK